MLYRVYRDRQRTLLSVDDLVESVLNKIPDLDNTYVIFSSDHGYHMGQFGMTIDKRQLYEFDIRDDKLNQGLMDPHKNAWTCTCTDFRVPLMIRGPGIIPGTKTDAVALAIDFAPTILDMAGIETPDYMDGKSLLPQLLVRSLNKCSQIYLIRYG